MKVQTTPSAVTYASWLAFAGKYTANLWCCKTTGRDRISLGMSAETLLTAYQPLGYCRTSHAPLRRRSPQAKNLIPAIGTTKVGSGRWSTFPSKCLFLLVGSPVAFRAAFESWMFKWTSTSPHLFSQLKLLSGHLLTDSLF
jgi:hypothetical protein